MAAYVIAAGEVTDPVGMEEYVRRVLPTVQQYGGRYLVAGAAGQALEGDWSPPNMAVIEFESVERARAWWESEEYREAKALRQRSARHRLIVVQGL